MATSVIVTPIPYNVPVPDGVSLQIPKASDATVDRERRVIYQIIRNLTETQAWIAHLDMDSCVETNRVEIIFPFNNHVVPFLWPISIEGTRTFIHFLSLSE